MGLLHLVRIGFVSVREAALSVYAWENEHGHAVHPVTRADVLALVLERQEFFGYNRVGLIGDRRRCRVKTRKESCLKNLLEG